jgi:RNA polymerase sigma-70 factor (ECF subfamily)
MTADPWSANPKLAPNPLVGIDDQGSGRLVGKPESDPTPARGSLAHETGQSSTILSPPVPGNEVPPSLHRIWQQTEYTNLTTAKKILANGISEQEAIDRAKQGDAECFEALYGLHKRRVYSLCLRMVGNTAEAEDLTQEAFLQLYRKIATFRGESAFSTWLHRLAVNVVLMRLRKKWLPEVSLEETLEPQNEDGHKRDIGARDNVLVGAIDRVNLERSIESLPPGYRIIFVLHDVEGYEHNEIAKRMGCSIGNSKSQLHKARMKLRDLLKLSQSERAAKR